MKGLPSDALGALAERAADLVDEPWDAIALFADDPSFRRTTFGGGLGLLTFHVNDETELIMIYDVTWAG